MMTTVIERTDKKGLRVVMKGATERVVGCCNKIMNFETKQVEDMSEDTKTSIGKAIEDMANNALRTLALCYKDIDGKLEVGETDDKGVHQIEKSDFILFAVIGVQDVLRDDVAESVKKC